MLFAENKAIYSARNLPYRASQQAPLRVLYFGIQTQEPNFQIPKFSNSLICSLPILARATDLSMHTTAQSLRTIRYSGYTYARPSIHALLYGRHTHIPKCWHNSSADANTRDTRPFRTSSIAKSNSVIYATHDNVSITTILHSKTHQVSQGSVSEKQSSATP